VLSRRLHKRAGMLSQNATLIERRAPNHDHRLWTVEDVGGQGGGAPGPAPPRVPPARRRPQLGRPQV